MTLEDFFTLTEMSGGLIVPARVEELVALIKKEKDCIVKNVGDARRQWHTVATVIAATENKDCLDLFIRSDGLLFINRWLKDAQSFSGDANGFHLEESILALLLALDKLGIGNEKLISSGIYLTVTDLLNHTSINIQNQAKSFLGNLKSTSMSAAVKLVSEEAQAVSDEKNQPGNRLAVESDTPISSSAISPDQKADVDQHVLQLVGDIAAPSGCCVNQQSEGVEAVMKEPNELAIHLSECDLKEVKNKVEYSVSQEACSSEQKSTSDAPDTKQGIDARREVSQLGSVFNVTNAESDTENTPIDPGKVEINPASISSILAETKVIETDGSNGKGTDNHVNGSTIKIMSDDMTKIGTGTMEDDKGVLMNCTVTQTQKQKQKTPSQGDENSNNILQDSSVDGIMLRKSHDRSHRRGSWGFESSRRSKRVDVSSKTSAMDLENGMVDALDIACLVAKEVERQVAEDDEEQMGSFSKKSSSRDGSPFEGSPVEKMSVEDSSGEDEPSTNLDDVDTERENDTGVVESSHVPETDKGTSEFDLNLEICSDDAGNNCVSNPVAIVSASKAVAVPGLPAPPLKFEGALGWKGSASTSAFRPASPRKTEKAFVFDLNFAEEGESWVEPSPKKSEKLSFDLNLMSEDRDVPFSPPRNFDLNDKPLNLSETSELLPCLGRSSSYQANSYGGSSNDSVISMMGDQMKQQHTFLHQQTPFSFFNGMRASEPVGPPSAPPPIYSYNVGPAMSFSPTMYGPSGSGSAAAYMVDPRMMMGAPPSTFHPSFAHQPAYTTNMVGPLQVPNPNGLGSFRPNLDYNPATNMVGTLHGPNGVGPFRPHLDFNPGFVIDGSTNRVDAGGFRHLFPAQGRSTQLQLQPLFPGIAGKRKEPEGGWEYHQPPPHL